METFFSESPLWYEKIGRIHALLERVKVSEDQHGDILRLRKLSRILTVHASTAIEGNRLSPGQVRDVVNGKPVIGPAKDIKEVQNAWAAYDKLGSLDPWSRESLLSAHALMTDGLIWESGRFRSVDVAVVGSNKVVLHRGADPADVPGLVAELFEWGKQSLIHPLIKSSAVHFMLEYIHPFRDGNGRIGRLWQTLILSRWNQAFAWLPVETLIHYNQAWYYQALQESHAGGLDCRPFIDCMLDVINNSMYKYIDVATETMAGGAVIRETEPLGFSEGPGDPLIGLIRRHDPENDLINDPINRNDPINNRENDLIKLIPSLLRADPSLTYDELAAKTGKSAVTVKRCIQHLKARGVLVRVGSKKTGRWEVRG
jgi:Fic family protein